MKNLKAQSAGRKTAERCRRNGISDAAFDKCSARHVSLEFSEVTRPKALEGATARPKKPRSEIMLAEAVLKDVASNTFRRPQLDGGPWLTFVRRMR